MKFHIVRTNETLEDIMFLYNLTKDEIVEENRHIRVWDKLIPGTKLKIPPIPEAVEHDVNDMEPFVEDYYPKLNPDFQKDSTKEDPFTKLANEIVTDKNPPFEEIPVMIQEEKIKDIQEASKKEKESTNLDFPQQDHQTNQTNINPIQKEIPVTIQPILSTTQTAMNSNQAIHQPAPNSPQPVNDIPKTIQTIATDISKKNDQTQLEQSKLQQNLSTTPSIQVVAPPIQVVAPPIQLVTSPDQQVAVPYQLGYYNLPRFVPYSIIYYPVYYKK